MYQASEYGLTRGTNFARKAAALLATQTLQEAVAFARTHWGPQSTAALELQEKANVGGAEMTDNSGAIAKTESEAEVIEIVRSLSLAGQAQFRRVPVNVPVTVQSGLATAHWIGSGSGIPLSKAAFARSTFRPKKASALTVFSKDLAMQASSDAIASIRDDLIESAVKLVDLALIDPANAGDAGTPTSITSGTATHIASSGDIADDVERALAAYTGNLRRAVWMTSSRIAAQAGIRAGGRGVAADLGAKGGTLGGIQVLTSENVPLHSGGGLLVLVDTSAIATVEDAIEISRSEHAMVEMSDAPTGNTSTPTGASATRVSLWQSDSVAARMVYHTNFVRTRDSGVVVVDEVDYSAA